MRTFELGTWSDFEGALRELSRQQEDRPKKSGRRLRDPLFRGLGTSDWGLETTLERSYPLERCDDTSSLRKYYRKISTAKPAIDSPPREAMHVCVYALLQDLDPAGSSDAHLFVVGPYMHSHLRHHLQQCRYTICVGIDSANEDFLFRPQRSGMKHAVGSEGELFKITIPAKERVTALSQLDLMNITAFSLFGSEDSLSRTIARRELLFRDWN